MSRHGSKNNLCHANKSFQYTEHLLFQGRAAASMVTGPFFVITPQKCSFRMPIQTGGVHVLHTCARAPPRGVACRATCDLKPCRNATVCGKEDQFVTGNILLMPGTVVVGGHQSTEGWWSGATCERAYADANARQVPTGGALGSYGCMQVAR